MRPPVTLPWCALLMACAIPALAGEVYEPARGSPLRASILDAARPTFEQEVGAPVEFVINTLNVMDEWAYGDVQLQRPGGTPIDWSHTKFAEDMAQGMLETGHNLFLLHESGGSWTLIEYAIGPTDVAWDWWRQQRGLPAELFDASSADFPPVATSPRPQSGN
ncbi:MAG: hypothetical protein AB7J30_12220 [Hyphomicrobium sp.]|uniref:hypothetical protein n=1 Tax=Hyphomicrobium sp. TaxID=82 RepID=UPI003D148993